MFAFSPWEAAMTGIGFVMRRPLWTLRFVLAAMVLTLGYVQLGRAIEAPFLMTAMVLVLVMICASAIVNAALLRKLLRDDDGGLFTLQLGFDELRLMIVIAVIAGGLAVSAVSGIIFSIVATAEVVSYAMSLWGPMVRVPVMVGMGLLCGGATLGLALYFGIRLSLSPAATIARRRVALAISWRLTRDRVWPLLKAYALSFTIACTFMLAFAVAAYGIWSLLGMAGLAPQRAHPAEILAALGTYASSHAMGSAKLAGAAALPIVIAQALANALASIFPAGVGANAYLAFDRLEQG